MTNLIGNAPRDIAAWKDDLGEWTHTSLTMMSELVSEEALEVSPEVRRQLKDMGYIQ